MQFNAPLHKKRKWLSSHLQEDLMIKYNRRSVPIIKGDTTKIRRGRFKGNSNKVASVNVKKQLITIEGATITKVDGTKVARPIHPSNVLITKLNLVDPWRRRKLEEKLSEEEREEIEKEAEEQIRELERVEEIEEGKEEEEVEKEKIEKPEELEEIEEREEVEKVKEAEEAEKIEEKIKMKLSQIPGIGPKMAEKLEEAGITVEDISEMTAEELQEIEGIGPKTAKKIKEGLEEIKK